MVATSLACQQGDVLEMTPFLPLDVSSGETRVARGRR